MCLKCKSVNKLQTSPLQNAHSAFKFKWKVKNSWQFFFVIKLLCPLSSREQIRRTGPELWRAKSWITMTMISHHPKSYHSGRIHEQIFSNVIEKIWPFIFYGKVYYHSEEAVSDRRHKPEFAGSLFWKIRIKMYWWVISLSWMYYVGRGLLWRRYNKFVMKDVWRTNIL